MDTAELRFGRFRLDPVRRVLREGDTPARLGNRAVDLLVALVERRGRVVAKRELFDLVWPDLVVEENNLQQHVSALRKLLGPDAIANVPGRGYRFMLPVEGATESETTSPQAEGAAAAPLAHLPAQRTPLIGRDADLDELCERIAAHALVTIVGPGGIGKTRLALAAAHACADGFADGAWAVDLSTLADGALVPAAVAHGLAVTLPDHTSEAASRQTLAAALRGQAMLLLLDNCEHLLDATAALVDALLQRAPRLHVLATSQEPLRLAGEQVVRLAPLAVPAPDHGKGGDALGHGAVQMFVERVRAVDRRFVPTPENIDIVVDICRRLDGLPLAIELAAARVPLLGLHGLRDRLDERLRLLAAGHTRAPPRQQTLRAALAWSHSLLGDDERTVFRRLGVFAGGFSIELVERVVSDGTIEPWAVLDHLGALVDKSLVIAEVDAEPRYRLLESARVFALEELERAAEAAPLRERHACAVGDLLEAYDRAIVHEPDFGSLILRLEAEVDNLRAAMQWVRHATAQPGADAARSRTLGIRLAAFSDWLWGELDTFDEGLAFGRMASSWIDDEVAPALAARLRLACVGLARARQRPSAEWLGDARLAESGCRAVGDRVGLYRILCSLAMAPRAVVSESEAAAMLDEAGALEDAAWSPRLRMRLQVSLEWFHDLGGRLEASRDAGRRNLALARAAGGAGEIRALGNLADTEFALGNVDEAIALCRAAIELAREQSRPAAATHVYANMVPALLERGDLDAAADASRAGRALLVRALGTAFEMLVPLASLADRRGDRRLAVRLLGCAQRLYTEAGVEMHPPERRMRDAVLSGLAGQASPAEVAAWLEEGARWSEDEAFAAADAG